MLLLQSLGYRAARGRACREFSASVATLFLQGVGVRRVGREPTSVVTRRVVREPTPQLWPAASVVRRRSIVGRHPQHRELAALQQQLAVG